MNTVESDAGFTSIDLAVAAIDLRRMLRVQIKEFVHTIEDVEIQQTQCRSGNINYLVPKWSNIPRNAA